LDVTTSRWIVEKLFKSELLKDRTVILVTHHVALLAPVTDYIVHMAVGGTVDHHGPIEQMQELIEEVQTDKAESSEEPVSEAHKMEEPVPEAKKDVAVDAGKLVSEEEKSEGRVSRAALIGYFSLAGGPIYWSIYYIVILLGEILFAGCNWWLGRWSQAYDEAADPRTVSIVYWLGMYVILMVAQLMCYNWTSIQWLFGALRASNKIHANLVDHILHAPMRFLDKTPTGRILGRFTKDINSIDSTVVDLFQGVSELVVTLALKAIVLVYIVPVFGPIGFVIGLIGFGLAELYIHGQLAVKREMSNAKTPLYTQFNAAVNGVISIRAYGAEEFFASELRDRCDKYTRCCVTFYNLNR
jgi:ABC-type transport system involved in cytochrome bd biosynthesis fused ATPase/permease subunit